MDKYRPKRPTSLNLFPLQPQAGTQDSINNNSLGKKQNWTDSNSASPHITGDVTAQDVKPKAESKVRPGPQRRPAPKPPAGIGSGNRSSSQATASADSRVRPRERPSAGSGCTPRSQSRAGGGAGRGAMKEKSLVELRGRDGAKERRGGRLCEDKGKDKDRQQRQREAGPRAAAAEGRGRGVMKACGGGVRSSNKLPFQEVLLPAMVVPRTPVAPRQQQKSQKQGQNHDRTQDRPSALSRSSSEGGSNRMSLSSDTEAPPPGPLHPSLSGRTNPDIHEEDGEGDPTPTQNHLSSLTGKQKPEVDVTNWKAEAETKDDCAVENAASDQNEAKDEAAFAYDSVKYTLVVDEHAQLELVNLKDRIHGHNDDSDTETVYQSANEEEDPEYEEERKRREEAAKTKRKEEEETKRKELEKRKKEEEEAAKRRKEAEEEAKRRREEDLKRRREEEVKRRSEVVAVPRLCKQSKMTSSTASGEESNGGRAPRSKKFLNLFANNSPPYSSTGAGSFGVFSCVLDGVERQQSHRAVYRFVPRHADELQLEMDDPVLMLNQSEDLWCHGYNMRTGASGIFPAFYVIKLPKDMKHVQSDGRTEKFTVQFLGSVQVPIHTGNDVLCAAMHKVACNRRSAGQPPSGCVLEVSMRGVRMMVQDQCHSAHRGDQCFHFFQLKNISFCGCHPKHSRFFGFITKHPDLQRFACHVLVSNSTLHPLAECVGRAFKQYYKEHVGYSCPTEDIFIE